jgi:hypothetical protein
MLDSSWCQRPSRSLASGCIPNLTVRVSRNVLSGLNAETIGRYIPGYLKELQDGHREELTLFKSQLEQVREKMVSFVFSGFHVLTF